MRQCEVYVHGIRAGILTEDDRREYTFAYDKAYLLGKGNPPVSLTMPLRSEPYHSPYLFPFSSTCFPKGKIDKSSHNCSTLMRKMISASC